MAEKSKILKEDACIIIMIIVVKAILFWQMGVRDTFDGNDMIAINGFNIFRLEVDDWRMPLYPFLFEICERFPIGVDAKTVVVCIQFICSSISSIIFLNIASQLSNSLMIARMATMVYALSGGVLGWDKVILTESLTLSITIVIIYYLVKYTKSKELKYVRNVCFWMTLSVFLRAANLIYVLIIGLFFILQVLLYHREKRERKKIFSYLGMSCIPILLYATIFYQSFGVFTLTNSSLNQSFNSVVQSGLYKDSTNERLIEVIEEERWDEVYINGPDEVKEFVSEVRQRHIGEYAKYLFLIVQTNWNEKFKAPIQWEETPALTLEYLQNVNWMSFGLGIVIGFLSLVVWLYISVVNKKCDWLLLGFAGFILGIYFLAIYGTNAEYVRTANNVQPFIVLNILYLLNMIKDKLDKISKGKNPIIINHIKQDREG